MNELFAFFVRNSKWFLFAIYVAISCSMLFRSDPYRRHVYLTSANAVAAEVYSVSNNITQYFNLRQANADLNRRNADLEAEVISLRNMLQAFHEQNYTDTLDMSLHADSGYRKFDFIVATVINNSVARPYNYITVNKGRADGIHPEMGVIDQNGVVGVVSVVGEHNSRVISMLNPKFHLSAKLKRSDYYGSLVWDGRDPRMAMLVDLPSHTQFAEGDTVVTSGFSAVFPAGLPVGVIVDDAANSGENFFSLRVKLFSDFTKLGNVQIVESHEAEEMRLLTQGEENDRKSKTYN